MFSTYLLVLAVLVGRLCVGFILTRQMRRSAISVKDPGAWQLIERCAREMEVRSVPQLLESPAVNVPLTLGVLRPAIVIPQSWRKWEEAKLAAVIAHELSHVRRRDPLTRMLAAVYRSIFWFSPLGWWLECQLANLGEQASDQAAIGAGTEPIYYAEVLMSFFRTIQSGQGRMNWQGARMAGGARAANRIDRVLSLKMLKPSGLKKSLLIGLMAGGLPVLCLTATARPKFTLASAAAPQSAAVAQASPAPLPAPAVPAVPPPASANGGPATVPSVSPSAPVPPRIKLQLPRFPNLQPEAQPVLPVLAANSDQERTPISTHNGMDFAIVSGQSVMMSGSEDNRSEVESLRKKIPGDFIWFIHNGNAYVIRDAATVQAAKQLYAPMEDLGRQQEALGKQQEELGRHQEELGKQMEAVRVDVPADLAQRLQAVEAKIKALGGSANMDQLGHLQGELGDLQGQLGSLQGKAGEAQGRLGQQQGALGEKQGELGHRQGELGREQGRIAHEAARQMQDIIGKALSNGTAKRVD